MGDASTQQEPLKVVLLGNTAVGKTNIVACFQNHEFSDEYRSTVGVEFITKRVEIDGTIVKLQIWDTAGQERFAAMMKTYYRKAKGALLIYDVTEPSSFTGLEVWRKHLESNADPRCVSMVVGNKVDAPAPHQVAAEQGAAYAKKHNMAFMETSARTGENIEAAFLELARLMLRAAGGGSGGGGPQGNVKLGASGGTSGAGGGAKTSSECC